MGFAVNTFDPGNQSPTNPLAENPIDKQLASNGAPAPSLPLNANEGDRGTSSSGQPMVFHGGRWITEANYAMAVAGAGPPGAPPAAPPPGGNPSGGGLFGGVRSAVAGVAAGAAANNLATYKMVSTPGYQPVSSITGAPAPAVSFDAVNQQASDVTAGLRAQLAGMTPRDAPLAAAPPPAQVTLADAGTLQRAAPIGASLADPTTLQRTAPISASLADPTTLQRTGAITDTAVDQGVANQTRAQQEISLAGLRAAALGTVPSAAELQLRQTTDRNIKNQYALAAALQGRSAGGALKQASDATGELDAQSAADAAVLRANEQAAARTAESTALSGVRTADLGVAEKQADITSATKVQNQNTDVNQNKTAADLDIKGKQFNAGQQQTAATTNQATDLTQNRSAADLDIKGKEFNAGQQQTADTQNQNTALGENKTQFQGGVDVSTTNANNATGVSKFNNTQAQALAIQNTENQLKQTQLDDTQKQVVMNAVLVAQGQQIQGVTNQGAYNNAVGALKISQQLANQAKTAAELQFANGLIGTLMGAIAAYAAVMQKGGGGAPVTQIPGVAPGTSSNAPNNSNAYPASTLYPQGGGVGGTDRGGGQTTDPTTDEWGNPIGQAPTGQGGDQ